MSDKIRVFISGPMRGLPNWNTEAFNEAQKQLEELGFAVFNPSWMKFDSECWDHESIIKIDFCALSLCDYMYRLSGWENSRGACEETNEAIKLYIPIYDNINDIPKEKSTKYAVEEILSKDEAGELEVGRYETIDCPVCNSKEHGGLIIKTEDGELKKLTASEECANTMNNINLFDVLSNLKMDDGTPIENGNINNLPVIDMEDIKDSIEIKTEE